MRNEAHFRNTPPHKEPVDFGLKNKTPLSKKTGGLYHCANCGTGFYRSASEAAKATNHFCSNACVGIFYKVEIRKNCVVCGVIFTISPCYWFRRTTCSRKCQAILSVPLPTERKFLSHRKPTKIIKKNCVVCGFEYSRYKSTENKYEAKYCSQVCFKKWRCPTRIYSAES